MKKKLALLLASVMTLSALPMNLFALSTNSLSNVATSVSEKTILFEKNTLGATSMSAGGNDIAYAVDGMDLVIQLNDTVAEGTTFRVELENAKWFFKNTATPTTNAYNVTGLVGTITAATTSADSAVLQSGTSPVPTTVADALATLEIAGAAATSLQIADAKTAMYNWVADIGTNTQADPTAAVSSIGDTGMLSDITGVRTVNGTLAFAKPMNIPQLTASKAASDYKKLFPESKYNYPGTSTSTWPGNHPTTYDLKRGVFSSYGKENGTGLYTRYPQNAIYTQDVANINYKRPAKLNSGSREVPYQMDIPEGFGDRTGTVTILPLSTMYGKIQKDYPLSPVTTDNKYEIRIPIVALTDSGNKEVKVRIVDSSNTSAITPTTLLVGSTTGTKTSTTVYDPKSTRDKIELERIVIKEERIGSIQTGGVIELKAPTGWTFNDPSLATATRPSTVEVGVESGLAWAKETGSNKTTGLGTYMADFFATYKSATVGGNTIWINGQQFNVSNNQAGDVDRSTILIYIPDDRITRSASINGAIYITGLEIYPDSNVSFAPVYMGVRTFGNAATGEFYGVFNSLKAKYGTALTRLNAAGTDLGRYDLNINTQTDILAGTRQDWTVALNAIAPIPTLISGRYVSDTQYAAEDASHKAAKVEFLENAVNAWWAARETKFSLPTGVKFRRINIGTADNLTVSGVTGDYRADGLKKANVTVDSDAITFYNMGVQATKKAKIAFESWLSVQSGFTGDITLTASNTTVPSSTNVVSNTGELKAVVAKAVDPITLDVKQITEVKVGYQTFATADVTITETAPNMLQKGKKLLVSVSDMITQDLYFAPINPATDVVMGKDSDLVVKNVSTVSTDQTGVTGNFGASINGSSMLIGGGTITMEIDRASTKASSITLKNLQVKVNRSVPQSTINYKIIAWGTAVAENYGPNKDEFTVPGIMKDYITIVSSATDKTSVLTQEVRLTIGEKFVLVSGKPVDMDAAAYLSTKSNSTMVPVRFVAQAFGITDDQIIYDDTTKTVTIIHPSRIVQFTNDSNKMMLNGAPVTMQNGATTEITKDRMYIPFRAIGDAFGISVDWDAATQTAVYNPATPVAAPAAAKK